MRLISIVLVTASKMSGIGKIRRRVKKVTQDGEVQKVHIRVKKPRELDENGNYIPHKHHHTNTTTDTYTEQSFIPVETADLTGINTQTMTDDNQPRRNANKTELRLPGQENPSDVRSTRSKKKYTAKALCIFEELGPDWVETRTTQKRFIKHDSDDEFEPGYHAPPESTIVDTVPTTTVISMTREMMITTNTIDFGEDVEDPFFKEIQDQILAEREARLQAKIRAKDSQPPTTDSVVSIHTTVEPDEDIPPYKLYPKSTCPEKYRPESEYPFISEPPYNGEYSEVEMLIEADPDTADFVEAGTSENEPMLFVEQSASTTTEDIINNGGVQRQQQSDNVSSAVSIKSADIVRSNNNDIPDLNSFTGYEDEEEEYYYEEEDDDE